MNRLVSAFFSIPAPWVVGAVFLFPALETALVLGAILPGEVVVILGGAIAGRGQVPLAFVIAAGIAGPIAGDLTGYLIGRRYGEELVRKRLKDRWARAHRWLSRDKGGATIFAGRFLPFLRSVLPITAGAVQVPARQFIPWDVAAAAVWGAGSALLGYFAARDLERILRSMHWITIGVGVLLVVAAAIGFWRWRGRGGKTRSRRPRVSRPKARGAGGRKAGSARSKGKVTPGHSPSRAPRGRARRGGSL